MCACPSSTLGSAFQNTSSPRHLPLPLLEPPRLLKPSPCQSSIPTANLGTQVRNTLFSSAHLIQRPFAGHYVLVEAYSGFQIHGTIVNVKSGLATYINLCAVYIVGLDLSAFRGEHWHEKLLAAETWLGSLLLPCGPFVSRSDRPRTRQLIGPHRRPGRCLPRLESTNCTYRLRLPPKKVASTTIRTQ